MKIKMQVNTATTAAICGNCGRAFAPAIGAMIVTAEDARPICDVCASPAMIEARDEMNSTPLPPTDPNFFGSDFMQDMARAAGRLVEIGDKVKVFNQNVEARYE